MARVEESKVVNMSGHDRRSSTSSDRIIDNNPAKVKNADLESQQHDQTHRIAVDSDAETESIGRQIEMESENSIKYRTCSWQKVGGGGYTDEERDGHVLTIAR
ncbi:hypothetical protein ASPWEDRAFT_36641 [Aspergillus wentii DTO 134E9]|uniref:Uncharacterized protein n=1 Tax=Aspergillus wentii DTO 134E9 TaxID=1073089 RepID=A0A1L9RVP9_ASPWE|nr:uncharacterized protein ASPWEDRAFT_36641 [Aspergillus wentii DTO 134E9]OJJ38937.1 hypothetical protein ASPWEDRAFT_36641 [Aspergillus wentii DTO 134E9]